MSDRYEPHTDYVPCELSSWDEMPSHWQIGRIKYMTEMNPSKSEVRHLKADTPVTLLPMESIGDDGSLDVSKERPLHSVLNGYTYLAEGDVCVAKITPCFENGKGAIVSGLRNGIGFATTEVIPMRCNRDTDSQFLYYFLTCAPFNLDAEASMYGAGGQKRVADSFVANYSAAFPPRDEQKQIAAFLDYETAKIDALIAMQQQLIALLGEKRQAVISHAVTKGLNPDAPMRDSGIEWLGEVPERWTLGELKRFATVNTGVAKGKDHGGRKTVTVPYLRVANVQDGYLELDDVTTIDILEHELERYRLRPGDVLMNEGGDFDKLGRGDVWEGQIDPCITQNHVFAVRPTGIQPRWLSRITSSHYGQFYFKTRSKQSTNLASISSTNLMQLPVLVPPDEEQTEILNFIERSTEKFDQLLEVAESQVELLQERRTALISAAVTGKIDVRGWKPPSSGANQETEMEVA